MNALVFRDGDHWIAQGLEFDIAAQASSLDDIHGAFFKALAANAAASIELGLEPFEGIGAAPQRFWSMWEAARLRLEPPLETALRAPHQTAIPSFFPRYRVTERVEMTAAA
ncbi:MAG: hypothetical protein KIS96_00395 [Bauldia sp.]|nr:hypothetical protein [Bauldia sp.]